MVKWLKFYPTKVDGNMENNVKLNKEGKQTWMIRTKLRKILQLISRCKISTYF
jgi:hypothetical protein